MYKLSPGQRRLTRLTTEYERNSRISLSSGSGLEIIYALSLLLNVLPPLPPRDEWLGLWGTYNQSSIIRVAEEIQVYVNQTVKRRFRARLSLLWLNRWNRPEPVQLRTIPR